MNSLSIKITLFLTYFLFGILLNSVGTVILQSVTSFGILKSDASILEGFKDLPIAIVSFFLASRIPYFGYKKSLVTAFTLVGLGIALMLAVPTFTSTKILFALTGIAFALVKVTVYAVIGLLTNRTEEHASLMNTIEGVFMTGVLSGYWIFSFFINPSDPSSLSWLNVYWLLGGLSFGLIALTLFVPMPDADKKITPSKGFDDLSKMIKMAFKPMVSVFILSAFLYVLIEQAIGTWLPTFNTEVLHLPNAMSIQATSIFALCLAVGRFGAGVVMKHFRWYGVLNVCVLAMAGLLLISMPLASNVQVSDPVTWWNAPIAAYIFPLIGLFMAPIYPAINSVILSNLPRQNHATMAGLIIVFSALGGTFGSFIVGHLFQSMGGLHAFYATLVPMMAILISLFFLKKKIEKEPSLVDEDISSQSMT